jgi:hypothetical protein
MMKLTLTLALFVVSSYATPSPYILVRGSNIVDASGSRLATGQVCFQAVGRDGVTPIGFSTGITQGLTGGGIVQTKAPCTTVTAGVMTNINIADSAYTYPANVAYRITILDAATGNIVGGTQPMQISCSTLPLNSACNTVTANTTFNLDLLQVGQVAARALIQNGAVELTGPAGVPGPGRTWPTGGAALVGVNSSGMLVAGPVVNVRDKGALGNGLSDDHAAFASALSSLPLTGGEIDVPCGQFYLGSTWVIAQPASPIYSNYDIGNPIVIHGQLGCSVIEGTGITLIEVMGSGHVLFENINVAESNPAGNTSTVGIYVLNAAHVYGQNVVLHGPGLFVNLGTGLLFNNSVCGTWVNTFSAGWNYGVSTGSTTSPCQEFIGGELTRNNWGAYIQSGEFNFSRMGVYDNAIGGLYASGSFITDEAMHYENSNFGATYDVHLNGSAYQSVNSSFESHPVLADGAQQAILMIGAAGSLIDNEATGGAYQCYFLYPRSPYSGVSGTGSCVYQDWLNYSMINRASSTYTMNPDGTYAVVGNITATSTVQGSGFVAGTNAGTTATVTCASGQHLTGITIVGGIITSTPGCN